jgi:hypothetical protein
MDRYWDARRGLLWGIGEVADSTGEHLDYHIVRESAWYALGLLMRGHADEHLLIRYSGAAGQEIRIMLDLEDE